MIIDKEKTADINDISKNLSVENKKYVIAVANALLFSQGQAARPCEIPEKSRKNLRQ